MHSPEPSGPRRRTRTGLVLAAVAGGAAVLLGALVWGGQRSVIYLPSGGEPPPAGEVVRGAEDVVLRPDDGPELGGWYVPAAGTDRDAAVLVTNGNAGNRESRAPLAQALAQEGFSVLVFDYRGYGGNDGEPTEPGLTADARAGLEVLRERGHESDRILYWGESLGAAVAVDLAVQEPPAGLFLRSPFSSLADMAGTHYPVVPEAMLRDDYPVRRTVADLHLPVSVAIGETDTVVPAEQSHAVAEAAPGLVEEFVMPDTGHNDLAMIHGPEVVDAFVRLADEVL
nr:alpha/beta hydrolase [Nocardiopsis xinjiangensis]